MHALLASLGTDGDILPFIGLGTVLRARGHRVTVVAAGNYSKVVADHELEFRELISKSEMEKLLGNPDFWHPLKTAQLSARWGAKLIEPQFELLKKIAGNDEVVLISNPAVFAAAILSEKFGHPLVHLVLQPWMIPSASAPAIIPVVGPPSWAPPFVHRILFRLIDVVGDKFIGPELNKVRRSQNLPPIRRILSNWFSKTLILGMFPPWFGPPQDDWPKQTRLVGFPHFDAAIQRALPGKVLDFVTRKKPTVIFTFGSGMMHALRFFEAAGKICEDIGAQALIISRFYTPEKLPPTMMHAPFLPFRELFPHCAAVVHHGGIGTTAEALACGIPQLICPLGFDQLDNGVRVAGLGAGLHTRSKHNLVPNTARISSRDRDEISNALKRLLSGEFREDCAALAQKMARAENALEWAANHVESVALCDSPRRR
jgi:rhamnosyltransferase subunit B